MAIQPVPPLVLASAFPTNADRTAGVWNARAADWAGSENAMATSVRNISSVTWNNANEAFNFATSANQSKIDAEAFKNQAKDYANSAGSSAAVVGRWDRLVLGPKSTPPTVDNDGQPLLEGAEYYNTVTKARYSWTGAAWMIGTNVTAGVSSVNGKTGVVNLGMDDVAPGSVVAYGPDKSAARAAIDAGLDYSRGQLTITTSQTLSKSVFGTATYVLLEMWGGGSSGWAYRQAGSQNNVTGSMGGEYVRVILLVSDIPDVITAVVGSGGTSSEYSGAVGGYTEGKPGGNSEFSGVKAFGGIVASAANTAATNGIVGRTAGGCPGPGQSGENSFWGGGGGGGASAGGGRFGGVSEFGGNGGDGFGGNSGSASDGQIPGGGGGSAFAPSGSTGVLKSGAGARGEIRLKWW